MCNKTEIIIETEDVYQEQHLERLRTGARWCDCLEYDVQNVVQKISDVKNNRTFSIEQILNDLESAHDSHGKPLRLVRLKRTTIYEVEVIEIFNKKNKPIVVN